MQIQNKGRIISGGMVFEITWDDGKKEEKSFLGTRCGLSWPSAMNPGGYFILVGQEARKLITGEKPLFIIREFQAQTLNALFDRMFDDMGMFGCFEIFTEISPRFESYIRALDLYCRSKRDLQDVKLCPAPYGESFLHGNDMIMRWLKVIKGLTIPKGFCIHSQLREIREDDLKGDPQNRFFAINGLRYVLGAFETSSIPERTDNRVVEKGIRPGAWT